MEVEVQLEREVQLHHHCVDTCLLIIRVQGTVSAKRDMEDLLETNTHRLDAWLDGECNQPNAAHTVTAKRVAMVSNLLTF